MIELTVKEMGFLLEILDKVQLQGIDAKEMQVVVMKKVKAELDKDMEQEEDA